MSPQKKASDADSHKISQPEPSLISIYIRSKRGAGMLCGKYHCALTSQVRTALCPFPGDCPAVHAPCNEVGQGRSADVGIVDIFRDRERQEKAKKEQKQLDKFTEAEP